MGHRAWLTWVALAAAILGVWRATEGDLGPKAYEPAFYHDTTDSRELPCPSEAAVVVAFGQSQSANSGEHISPPRQRNDLFQFFNDRCFQLRDPVLGATGGKGSIWVPAAARLADVTGEPVVIVAAGVNGSSIAEWTANQSPLSRMLSSRIASARKAKLRPSIYVWIQGELDAELGTTTEKYLLELRKLRKIFDNAAWLITSNSICSNKLESSSQLNDARAQFAKSSPNVTLAANLDSLGLEYRTDDRCHFNRLGQQVAGEMVGDAIARVLARR